MAVTLAQPEILYSSPAGTVYRFAWTSSLEDPTYYVYQGNELLATTALEFWDITVQPGVSAVVQVFDADETADAVFSGFAILGWASVTGGDSYRVQEYVSAAWTTRETVQSNGTEYYNWRTRYLEDVTTHQFRVVPVGENSEDGEPMYLDVAMVRHPDAPVAVVASFDSVTDYATFTVDGSTFEVETALADATDHWFVARRRNKYGVVSQNIRVETDMILRIDGSGDESAAPPSAPFDVAVSAGPDGTIAVSAAYNSTTDADPADSWAIWCNVDGTDPDPDNDAVASEVAMTGGGTGIENLTTSIPTSGEYPDQAPGRVVVRTRRSGTPDVDSTNATVLSVTVDRLGPARPSGVAVMDDTLATRARGYSDAPVTPGDDYVIDVGNSIRIEQTNGWSLFYADTALVWALRADSCAGVGAIYIPSEWDVETIGAVGSGGSADALEVIAWTGGDKRLGINVGGVRVGLIDVTNTLIRFGGIDAIAALTQRNVITAAWTEYALVRFTVWDPGAGGFVTAMAVDDSGVMKRKAGFDYNRHLNQAAIEALV